MVGMIAASMAQGSSSPTSTPHPRKAAGSVLSTVIEWYKSLAYQLVEVVLGYVEVCV